MSKTIIDKRYIKWTYFMVLMLTMCGIAFYKFDISWLSSIGILTVLALFCLWFALIGKIIMSAVATSFTVIIVQLMNQAKIYYFKSRLFFTDFFVMADGHNFDTLTQYWELLVVLIVMVLIISISLYCYRKGHRYGYFVRLCSLLIFVGCSFGIYQITLSKANVLAWQAVLPNGKGVIINLWMTMKGMQYASPEYSGDDSLFLEKAAEIDITQGESVKPDIVVFLQESTTDRDYFYLDELNLPKISMFDPNADFLKAYGPLRVQTTGGGTWLSEFSFATGLDTDDFAARKHSVFYTVAPHVKTSFYQELKNNGYYTVLLTPMTKNNYNTSNAYQNFGIDLVLQPQDLGYDAPMSKNLWKITSEEMLDYVMMILNQHTDRPVAIFMLSMNEHGPYDDMAEDRLGIEPYFEDPKVARRLNDYLERQDALNIATDNFADKVLNRDKPTLFLYFGDHQPALYGKAVKESNFNNRLYITQFYLKDNIDGNSIPIQGSLMDINFLGGLILERIAAKVSPYYMANIKMRHLCGGKLADCADEKLVNSYKHYIYHTLRAASN